MNIDWSKAPEGATHKDLNYAPTGFWYKFDFQFDTAAYCPPGEKVWIRSGKASEYNDGSMDNMATRPSVKDQNEVKTKVIDEIVRDLDVPRAIAARAYSLGYRKFEIVEEDV